MSAYSIAAVHAPMAHPRVRASIFHGSSEEKELVESHAIIRKIETGEADIGNALDDAVSGVARHRGEMVQLPEQILVSCLLPTRLPDLYAQRHGHFAPSCGQGQMAPCHDIALVGIVLDAVEGIRPELTVFGSWPRRLRYDSAVSFLASDKIPHLAIERSRFSHRDQAPCG
ncbi:hypothetical protein [Rhizobium binae]|uniref:hypothetical protein n=1 Tax=Rhizobium binae TaxID=1138190 RepID=UPI003DA8B759